MYRLFFLFTLLGIVVFGSFVNAQVMSSSNYSLQSDSINFGGGFSNSNNYSLESSIGERATGESNSASYKLKTGYQQMQEVYLALSSTGNVNMSPAIPGVGGGSANGSTTFTAITDGPSGYQLTIKASTSPTMVSGADSIADYAPAGSNPDLIFTTATADSHFGYSPFGVDVVQRFQTNGSSCNVSGSASSTACWDGLSTSTVVVAQSSSSNQPTGTDTAIYFKVEIGSSVVQTSGTYIATSTVTLLSL